MQDSSSFSQMSSHQGPSSQPRHPGLIVVIADDFTGAAEIGGMALRHGFETLVSTSVVVEHSVEVLVIITNTREESPEQARKTIANLTLALIALEPVLIYKKIDSVLRGNVAEELMAQMEISKQRRALIIPANPALNRKISNGIYYYNDVPLNRSDFTVTDGEPSSPKVIDLLGRNFENDIKIISKGDEVPDQGLIVGDTVDYEDLNYWTALSDGHTVLAGGSGFFDALLRKRMPKNYLGERVLPRLVGNRLFVCGSAFEQSRRAVADVKNRQLLVYMPTELFDSEGSYEQLMLSWEDEIVSSLTRNETTIIAVDNLTGGTVADLPEKIARAFAEVVESVMKRSKVNELLVEGGHTALSIIENLNYQQFYPVQEVAIGVIRLKVKGKDDLFLTLKPGSYRWPESVWVG